MMRKVFTAQTPQEAHLVRGFLEENGIPAVVQGEHLSWWLQGGVPLAETYPTVWVERDEDEERAKALLEEFQAQMNLEAEADPEEDKG